jgi:hypothetical protein
MSPVAAVSTWPRERDAKLAAWKPKVRDRECRYLISSSMV